MHVRRAGWFGAQQLGAFMLEQAIERGARLVPVESRRVLTQGDRVTGVELADGFIIPAANVVIAAGPMARAVAATADVDLPLFSELHLKVAFRDHLGIIPRSAPMVIWSDPQMIDWTEEEREGLAEMGRDDLLGEMPVFCHGRPEGHQGSDWFLALWEYHHAVLEPVWPLPGDDLYPEVVMRGLTTMIPGLAAYRDRLPQSMVDGGYYTKTAENRPLIGPCGPEGLHVVAGLSGFGVMAAAGAADLAARHIKGDRLPSYAEDFLLARYRRPGFAGGDIGPSGQL
jgi:glycine/D-amino acid oxidase-like deaminating enzyme